MIDCQDIAIRETLPEFVHEALDDDVRERVHVHVEMCEACAAELELIRTVIASAPITVVDAARIARAVMPYRRQARTGMSPTYLRLAAAFLVTAVGVSAVAIGHYRSSEPVSGAHTAAASSGVELIGVSDLSDDHLEELIEAMDHLDAVPPREPEPSMAPDGGA